MMQFAAARFGDVVDLHIEAFLALDYFFFNQAAFLQLGQRAVDLALVGRRSVDGWSKAFWIMRKNGLKEEAKNGVFE
ncbi:hypothetical protein [Candidatus Villigracilis saccharophilus]|uniref:hypothetical protein n=1 Tax=Candidatus Villigracilis saccharophilus TaxID=3140684 RepID=UPI0031EB159C